MVKVTVTIRGLDRELLRQARANTVRRGIRLAEWLDEAISAKLLKDALLISHLDGIAQPTDVEGVFRIPKGTVKVGDDYSLRGLRICAAGRKEDEEVVTYKTPSTLVDLGYRIFWIR